MACASCGGGRSLSPNTPVSPKVFVQSQNRIVVAPKGSSGSGFVNRTNPNAPIPTKRTTV